MTTVTEEKQIERLKFAGAKKASMKRRDAHHDYTERRMYMVTLEVEGRRPVFGHLVGDAFAERGSLHEPRIELSELGKAVQSEWLGIHRHYPQIEVKAVQMMHVAVTVAAFDMNELGGIVKAQNGTAAPAPVVQRDRLKRIQAEAEQVARFVDVFLHQNIGEMRGDVNVEQTLQTAAQRPGII